MTEEEARKKQCRVPITVVIGVHGAVADAREVFPTYKVDLFKGYRGTK